MSKIKEAVTRPARTEIETVAVKCDLCGKVSHKWRGWAKNSNDVNEVEIKHRHGYSYPDGGSVDSEAFDVCPGCWTDKVVPWFKEQGAEPSTETCDF
jgi:hypothetical protein